MHISETEESQKTHLFSVHYWIYLILLSYKRIMFLPIGVIVAGSSVVPNLLFYKCPHCGKHLGSNGGDFCQYCGKSIDN